MTDPDQQRPKRCDDPRFRILETTVKQWRFNRFLYQFVGAEWAWTDKLIWTDEQWRSYVEEAWKLGQNRVWVHTCTLDHDAALANYKARGMVVYKTETTQPN
jgi:hypothetical protein